MFPWQDLLELAVRGVILSYFQPVFWVILALVGYQYWRMQKNQRKMFGIYNYTVTQQLLFAVFGGSIGGIVASFLLTVAGVTVNRLGINYILPVALLLMAINMRFICFAYAGGLVAVSHVLFGWPNVSVPQVLSLVAILHIVESLLIAVSGHYSVAPLIIRRNDGRFVGAFNLQNFWPLPLVVLMAVPGQEVQEAVLAMPDWWPLLRLGIEAPPGQIWVYGMIPIVAALGYTDLAVSSSPGVRRRSAAIHLAVYSILLLTLAILSEKYIWLQLTAALLSPLGHEYLIQRDSRRELEGVPRYVQPDRGAMILDTVYGSPAREMGLRAGDILLSMNGMEVNRGYDLAIAISSAPMEFVLEIEREGQFIRRQGSFAKGHRQLGIILVPEGHEEKYAVMETEQMGVLDWFKNKRRIGRND